jgi:hypothetical protein
MTLKKLIKNKNRIQKLTPIQKINKRKKYIKEDSAIKSKLIKFEEIINNKNIYFEKYKGGKKYPVGQIWPSKYDSKNSGQIRLLGPYNYREKEFVIDIYIPKNRLVLLPNKTYTLIIDYPLTNIYEQEIKVDKYGLTLREVVNLAVDAYKKIYKEEAKTSKLKEETIAKRSKGHSILVNRAPTDGKYGIWGHTIEDLCITHVIVKGSKIYLSVDS